MQIASYYQNGFRMNMASCNCTVHLLNFWPHIASHALVIRSQIAFICQSDQQQKLLVFCIPYRPEQQTVLVSYTFTFFRLFMKGKFDAYVYCDLWPKEFKFEQQTSLLLLTFWYFNVKQVVEFLQRWVKLNYIFDQKSTDSMEIAIYLHQNF